MSRAAGGGALALLVTVVLVLVPACGSDGPSASDTSTGPTPSGATASQRCEASFDSDEATDILPTLQTCKDVSEWLAGLVASGVGRRMDLERRADQLQLLASLCTQSDDEVQRSSICRAVADIKGA